MTLALFRLTKGGHSRKESGRFRQYKAGDEILLNESEQKSLRGRVEMIRRIAAPEDDADQAIVETSVESAEKIQPPTPSRSRRSRRS